MFHVVLFEPEIPPNTGNIIRLCANTGSRLHLVAPLGFELDDRGLRRAGLDYDDLTRVEVHGSLDQCLTGLRPRRLWSFSTHGKQPYNDASYHDGDALLFGPETRGLPARWLASRRVDEVLRIPMVDGSRSLNLSNAVAVVLYEALRQQGFASLN